MEKNFLHLETPIVFLALYWRGPEAVGLADVLFTFDYLDRATLTRDELEGHLNTLLSAGLIEMQPGFVFAIPPAIYRQFDEFRRRRRKGRFEDAETFVRRYEWQHPAPKLVRIPEAAFAQAREDYRQKFARADRSRARAR